MNKTLGHLHLLHDCSRGPTTSKKLKPWNLTKATDDGKMQEAVLSTQNRPVLPGVAISRQSGYFGKPVAGKNLWLVATMIVAIFGLRIGLFVAIFGIVSELGYLWLFLDLKLKWL